MTTVPAQGAALGFILRSATEEWHNRCLPHGAQGERRPWRFRDTPWQANQLVFALDRVSGSLCEPSTLTLF